MLGTIIYVTLDVSFNILYWLLKKTYGGISMLVYYFYNNKEGEKIEINMYDLKIIKNQLELQNEMIKELKQNTIKEE